MWEMPAPDAGSTEGLEHIASYLTVSSTQLGHLQDEVLSIKSRMTPAVWSGEAREEWDRQVLDYASTRIPELGASHRRASRAIRAYVATVEDIKGTARRIRSQVELIDADAMACGFLAKDGSGDGFGSFSVWVTGAKSQPRVSFEATTVRPGPLSLEDLQSGFSFGGGGTAALQAWAGFYSAEVQVCLGRMKDQAVKREEADKLVVSQIRASFPQGWAKRKAMAKTLGITNPTHMTDHMLATRLGKQMNGGDLSGFDDFYDRYRDEPAVLATLMNRLGPKGLEKAMIRVADKGPEAGYETLCQLRGAFATATHAMTNRQANAFVDGLFACIGERDFDPAKDERAGVLAFVFGQDYTLVDDPLLVPSSATALRAAGIVDAWEAEHGRFVYTAERDPTSGIRSCLIPDLGDRIETHTGALNYDVSGAVLRTLAQHPVDLAGWLYDDGDINHERVDRWFGRDWGASGDEFQTPAMMLKSVQVATALDGDPAIRQEAAAVTTWALLAMQDAEDAGVLRTSDIRGRASADFAAAVAMLGPGVEQTLLADPAIAPTEDQQQNAGFLEVSGVVMPAVDSSMVFSLMKYGSVRAEGQGIIDAYVAGRRTELVGHNPDGLTPTQVVERVGAWQGAQAGAYDAAALDKAHTLDAEARQRIDAVVAFASAVPVAAPATGAIATTGSRVLVEMTSSATLGEATAALTEQGLSSLTTSPTGHVRASVLHAAADQAARRGAFENDVRGYVDTWRADGQVMGTDKETMASRGLATFDLYYEGGQNSRGAY